MGPRQTPAHSIIIQTKQTIIFSSLSSLSLHSLVFLRPQPEALGEGLSSRTSKIGNQRSVVVLRRVATQSIKVSATPTAFFITGLPRSLRPALRVAQVGLRSLAMTKSLWLFVAPPWCGHRFCEQNHKWRFCAGLRRCFRPGLTRPEQSQNPHGIRACAVPWFCAEQKPVSVFLGVGFGAKAPATKPKKHRYQ